MAFQHGLSGLNAAAKNLDVIGHNIANANTTGFKASRAEFAEMVASSMGAASGQNNGIGVEVAAVAQQFTQGNVNVTGNSLDVAINGNGFFVLKQPDGTMAYTRAGNFKLDKEGDLRTNGGQQVMGFSVNPATGTPSSTLQALSFPTGAPIEAKQTTQVTASLNLDARVDHTVTPPAPRSTYGTSIEVFDSQGVATTVSMYYEKVGANTWDQHSSLDPKAIPDSRMVMDGTGKMVGLLTPVNKPSGDPASYEEADYPTEFTYTFYGPDQSTPPVFGIRQATLSGNAADMWNFTRDPIDNTIITGATLNPALLDGLLSGSGTALVTSDPADLLDAPLSATQSYQLGLTIDPSAGNPNSPPATPGLAAPGAFDITLDLSGITQFGSKYAVSKLSQDGYAAGELVSINIADDGKIMASYSNGVTRAEAQVALANFANLNGLQSIGDNNWVATSDSGAAIYGSPGSGTFGDLRSGALEDSNVDLTAELVGMMTAQRHYQANAQTIKTQDQVFSTLINLR